MNGRKPRSGTLCAIAALAIAAACTPARHEVQTDVVKSVSFKGNGGAFSFDQGDYALAGAMAQGDSGFGVTIWPLLLLLAKLFGQDHNRAEPNRAVPADAAKGPPRG